MFSTAALSSQKIKLEQDRYKAACDEILIGRAKNKKQGIKVSFKNGSSKDFIFNLANK